MTSERKSAACWIKSENFRTHGDAPGIDIGADDGANIALVHFDYLGDRQKAIRDTNTRANLISAAPQLLNAAKLAYRALDLLMGDSDLPEDESPEMLAMQSLSHAIAKAEGSAP